MARRKKRPENKRSRGRRQWRALSLEQQAERIAALAAGREKSAAQLKERWAAMTPEERSDRARERALRHYEREGEKGVFFGFHMRPEQLAYLQEMALSMNLPLAVILRSIIDERLYVKQPW
jgi:hypothetical protein